MINISRVLCPIDFSSHSRRALDHAVAIARRFTARVSVIHVVAPEPPSAVPVDREQIAADMRAFVQPDLESAGVPIDTAICDGRPVDVILQRSAGADLVVIGAHGRSGVERLVLGSVTERVIRRALCPVLTVPSRHPESVPSDPVVFRNILCPVDFSAVSARALDYAALLAQEVDGRLVVVHVMGAEFEPLAMRPAGIADGGMETMMIGDYFRWREEEMRHRLERVVPPSVSTYCAVETVLRRGRPGAVILDLADEKASDLIVMGVQARGAAERAFFGSVAQHVIRHGTRPVLTVTKS